MKIIYKYKFTLFLILNITPQMALDTVSDLTIVGYIKYEDGLGRIPIGLINSFERDLKINVIPTRNYKDQGKYIPKSVSVNNINNKTNVSILTDVVFYNKIPTYHVIPSNSKIKIAYSMFETTAIPEEWVKVLNKEFDAVVVPDSYLITVYNNAGVNIPIFMLPLGLNLHKFLSRPQKNKMNKSFTFGTTVAYHERKNHELLIKSFIEEFGNSKDFILKINGRSFDNNNLLTKLQKLCKNYNNIILTSNILTQEEYIEFMSSLDCFINISKGEGYSVPPRESLALGIPCILSNNTAQKSICNTGYIREVDSKILEPAFYKQYGSDQIGYFFNSTILDIRKAMRGVYLNYNKYLALADLGKSWVQQYTWYSLKPLYLNLIKPKKIILGDKNLVTEEYLMTSSKKLYEKYLTIKN
ncbi:MAG: glycosyltransferase [Candidatus Babeliales bacterium]|nr:glycosyltransferase [Candidatus Babeliales bacterium]